MPHLAGIAISDPDARVLFSFDRFLCLARPVVVLRM